MEDVITGPAQEGTIQRAEPRSPARSLSIWKSLLALGLLAAAVALTAGFAWLSFSNSLGQFFLLDERRHTDLQEVRRSFLQMEETLAGTRDAVGIPSSALRERVDRLEASLRQVDLALVGAPEDDAAALLVMLADLRGRLASSADAPAESGMVSRQALAAARTVVNQWLVIDRRIDEESLLSIADLSSRSRWFTVLLAGLGLGLVGCAGFLIVLASRKADVSLMKLLTGYRRLASGDLAHRINPTGSDDFKILLERFNDLASGMLKLQDRTLDAGRAREGFLRQVSGHLDASLAGKSDTTLPETGDQLARELIQPANALMADRNRLMGKLAARDEQVRDWQMALDEDVAVLLKYLRDDFFMREQSLPELAPDSRFIELRDELHQRMERVQAVIRLIRDNTDILYRSSTEIAENSGLQEKEFNDEYQVIHETAASVNEVSVAAKQSSQMVEYVFRSAQDAMETAEEGHRMIQRVMEGMGSITAQVADIAQEILNLSEKSQEIGKIIKTISDISKQTNLLALNAAIEAAGAGEHGKGFAVVAKEIRELAARSATATKEIEKLIALIQQTTNSAVLATEQGSRRVDHGVEMVTSLKNSFHRIIEKFQEVVESAHQISTAAQEQTVGARQVAAAINEIDKMMRSSLDNIGQFREVVNHYKTMTESLREASGQIALSD